MIKAETYADGSIYVYGNREDGSKIAFAPIPGYANRYLASEDGDIFSFAAGFNKIKKLSPSPTDGGYLQVTLSLNGQHKTRKVHQLILEAFVGPRPEGLITLHANDIPDDNKLSNLRWGTYTQNQLDCVANGNHVHARKTTCNNGHPYNEENTFILKTSGKRTCRICRFNWEEAYKASGKRQAQRARYISKAAA